MLQQERAKREATASPRARRAESDRRHRRQRPSAFALANGRASIGRTGATLGQWLAARPDHSVCALEPAVATGASHSGLLDFLQARHRSDAGGSNGDRAHRDHAHRDHAHRDHARQESAAGAKPHRSSRVPRRSIHAGQFPRLQPAHRRAATATGPVSCAVDTWNFSPEDRQPSDEYFLPTADVRSKPANKKNW